MHKELILAGTGLLVVCSLFTRLGHADEARDAAVPDALKPAAGQVLSLSAIGDGVQIYQCVAKDDPTQFSWTLKAPEASLKDDSGKSLGKHYAGPTWEATDGSKVVGEPVAKVDAPDHESIPWLLVRAKTTTGRGTFSDVTSIQRLRTRGGKAPNTGCDSGQAGKEVKISYSALYRFYTAAR